MSTVASTTTTGTTVSVEIPAALLKAAARFKAKEMGRYAFDGVLVEETGAVVATDGRILLAILPDSFQKADKRGRAINLPPETVKAAIRAKAPWLRIIWDWTTSRGTVDAIAKPGQEAESTVALLGLEGEFPDWRAVVSWEEASGKPVRLNAHFLTRTGQAFADLVTKGAKGPNPVLTLHPAGPKRPVFFTMAVELEYDRARTATGIVMPVTS